MPFFKVSTDDMMDKKPDWKDNQIIIKGNYTRAMSISQIERKLIPGRKGSGFCC